MSEKLTKKKKKTRGDRAVTKISSYQVFTISSWGTVQTGSSFGDIFIFFFPTKIAGGRAHISRGDIPHPQPLVTALGGQSSLIFFPLFFPCTI